MAGFDVDVTIKGIEQFRRGMERQRARSDRDQYAALMAAAATYRTGIYKQVKAAIGSDRELSGMNKRIRSGQDTQTLKGTDRVAMKLGVVAERERERGSPAVRMRATPEGQWSIVESGRRGGYKVRARRTKAIVTPYGYRKSARPGPTRGKHPWARGLVASHRKAAERYQKVIVDRTRRNLLYG